MLSALTIVQAHEKLRRKEISSVELVRACIERIEAIDGTLNAVVHRNFERALEEAKNVDERGAFDHPLTGIPYLAKDVFCEAGVPTLACSNVLRDKDYIPPFDSTTTKRLKTVHAISLGKTNTDEFTMGCSTETSCFGPTRNPWDAARVAGGSSGGSAAAVAGDESLFALGTDTGGSIRQPAGFCGCTGLRVTYGRTSRSGVMSMASSLDTIGPLCKTVEDTAIVLEAIAGRDPYDATTGDVPVPHYRELLRKDCKGIRIGIPKEYFIDGTHPEVEAAVREAAGVLQALGALIVDISLPMTQYGVATYYVIVPCEVSSNMARYDGIRYGHTVGCHPSWLAACHGEVQPSRGEGATNPCTLLTPQDDKPTLIDYYERVRSEGFGPEVKRRIMLGTFALSAGYYDAYYRQAQKVRTLIKRDFADAFSKVDVIIAPVSPTPAFAVGAHEGDPVAMYLEDVFLCPQPMAGIPALSLPCGFSRGGLPIGLQIMGPQWEEGRVLRVGSAYEQATEWHTRKPVLSGAQESPR